MLRNCILILIPSQVDILIPSHTNELRHPN